MPILYVMCGIPGAGKSTWVRNYCTPYDSIHISRDEIRFNMVKATEPYFSKERKVFKEFIKQIKEGLEQGQDVFADATHINFASRNKILQAINHNLYDEVQIIYIDTPLDIAIKQNELRRFTRSYVPPEVIEKMYSQFEEPTFDEGFSTIYIVKPNEPIIVKKKG